VIALVVLVVAVAVVVVVVEVAVDLAAVVLNLIVPTGALVVAALVVVVVVVMLALQTGALSFSGAPVLASLKYQSAPTLEHPLGAFAFVSVFIRLSAARGSRTVLALSHSPTVANRVS
jgi:hypothetical protein